MNPLQAIPGIGPRLAADLHSLGIRSIPALARKNPEQLYHQLCARRGPQDPCVLYAFRCAVYYAKGGRAPQKLKWWNWMNPSRR